MYRIRAASIADTWAVSATNGACRTLVSAEVHHKEGCTRGIEISTFPFSHFIGALTNHPSRLVLSNHVCD